MAQQPSADYRLPLAIEPRAESLDSMTTRSYQSPPDWRWPLKSWNAKKTTTIKTAESMN